jgi:hypothetical protein
MRELVPIRELQLAQHRRYVGFHGLGGDLKFNADLFIGVTTSDETKDLAFAGSQLIEFRVAT